MPSHRRGGPGFTTIITWRVALFLIIVVLLVYAIDSADEPGLSIGSGKTPPTTSATTPVAPPSLINKRTLAGNVEETHVKLIPNEWSEWVTTPMASEHAIYWDTVTGDLEIWYRDGTVLIRKMGDKPIDVGFKRGVFKFRSLKGGKVLVVAKGDWKDFFEWK